MFEEYYVQCRSRVGWETIMPDFGTFRNIASARDFAFVARTKCKDFCEFRVVYFEDENEITVYQTSEKLCTL